MSGSEVFLSYNREDHAVAQRFAAALQAQGYGVWWDTTLRAGDAYDEVTERALREARAVVVLWSRKSVVSRWVRAEATLADRNGTLVPVMLEPCERPIMFELTQTADLSHWGGDATDAAWLAFLADLKHAVRNRQPAAVPAKVLVADAAQPAEGARMAAPRAQDHRPSLAILPFTNRSGERSDDVFAEGMVEDLVGALSLNAGLKVIAQSATAGYRGNTADLRRIGQDLGVRYLLEGNVRRVGGNLRVSAQLVEADTGAVLWVQKFDRPLQELADLQEQLVTQVAGHLGLEVERAEMARALRKPGDLTAWEAVMRAQSGFAKVTHKSLLASAAEARRAVDIQPDYAPAHAMLADSLAALSFTYMAGRDPALAHEARLHAERALALDTDDPLVLRCAGRALGICGDWERGLEYCRRSVELNPNSASGRCNLATLCVRLRLPEEAIQNAEAALQIAPRGFLAYLLVANLALANFQLGRHEQALLGIESSLLLNPAFTYTLKDKVVVLEKMGRRTAALDTLRKLRVAESSMTLQDLQAANLALFHAPEDAAEMNSVLERLWPEAEPDAPRA
jgi:TolB-like protein/Tfp pilus assembly protein PilF